MSIIKSADVAYVRLQVPDLDVSEQFLLDFGLIAAGRDADHRYFRTSDPAPYCYVISQGERKFLGFAFHAKSQADMEALSSATGVAIEPIEGPCGGSRVRLQEPNGYDVDVVFGMTPHERIVVKRQAVNTGDEPLNRAGELYRLDRGKPTPVKRLAHIVMGTPRIIETINWFKDTLGVIASDDIVVGPNQDLMASFMRIDMGDAYVDHHALFLIHFDYAGLQHIAFEVPDFDAVMADNDYLRSLGRYDQVWGIGRHKLGAQVFDYWLDPFGIPHEHWADSDRLNAAAPTNTWEPQNSMISQWGGHPPEKFKIVIP
jgi:catechol 2,3-dioxygenase-like lactoylglutathione lyase family enzyme